MPARATFHSVDTAMALTKDQLAEQLRQHRALRGLNQKDVAALVGVELRTYQRWEAGERMPYNRHLVALAEALDVDAETLTGAPHTADALQRIEQAVSENNRLLRQAIVHMASAGLGEEIAQQNDLLARQSMILERITQALARVQQLVEALGVPDGTTLQDHLAQIARETSAEARQREGAPRS